MPSKKTSVIIKAANCVYENFNYQLYNFRPRLKNLPVNLKLVKKVEIKKNFHRENSVFADFKAETK